MNYNRFKYIYPPRPEMKIHPDSLKVYDNSSTDDEGIADFLAQPKLNGSSMQVYTNGKLLITMNRHKKQMNHKMDLEELKALHKGKGWMVLCGEYMNKSQRDENDKIWNHKFVIFDILVYEGKHLLGTTFEERYELLKELYPYNPAKMQLHQISENCFRVNSVRYGFTNIFNDITKYQMYEGLVLKNASGKLENGTTEKNNTKTQLKCRKPTKNYAF